MSTEHNDCFSWKLGNSSTQEAANTSHRNGSAMLAFDYRSVFSKFSKEFVQSSAVPTRVICFANLLVRYCLLFKAYVLANYRRSR